jgi:hypothetical protein
MLQPNVVASLALAVCAAVRPELAVGQSAIGQAETASSTVGEYTSGDPGADFTRPLNLFQLRYEYRSAPGSGAEPGTTTEVITDTGALRLDHRIDLSSQWAVGLRTDLPFAAKNPINSYNLSGEYVYGLGDADFQAALIYVLDARWRMGAGVRVSAPTGDDVLGSGKWRIMPVVGAHYELPELSPGSYEPLVRYDQSFAGNPQRPGVSNLQFAPTLNIGLPERWFFTLYPSPEIRVNYGSAVVGQTGRLFLPLAASIGRMIAKDVAVSLEVGVPIIKEYPVYNFKTEIRVNVTF